MICYNGDLHTQPNFLNANVPSMVFFFAHLALRTLRFTRHADGGFGIRDWEWGGLGLLWVGGSRHAGSTKTQPPNLARVRFTHAGVFLQCHGTRSLRRLLGACSFFYRFL